ncbi:heterokaryon incompatibility protein-domain-containing protein [Pisolithus croceorrhizus]|nr:heterokaryon incompatibility protein-domain-containing protein [Pisolithus croceorrhizus]KAI6107829.1 heterokaryon incompatibility protein-domain-containing protein [Pisolithus croceorrhizus]KAI6139643.1 heterokaryon incompatibility protein-domain-containing protein [Pisolithus thermaeus]
MEDLEECITLRRTLLGLTPLGHRNHRSYLINLADRIKQRYRKEGKKVDLDEVIALWRSVLEVTPPGNPERRSTLVNLADRLYERFKINSATADLDEVITLWRAILELTPSDHPERPSTLVILADRLEDRFRKLNFLAEREDSISSRGEDMTSDLEQTVTIRRTALECTPPGHPDRPKSLVSLANSLHKRFQSQGDVGDLAEAAELSRAALVLLTLGHGDHASTRDRPTDYLKTKVQKQGASAPYFASISASSSDQSLNEHRIMDIVFKALEHVPLRLVNTTTGLLCSRDAQISCFQGSGQYSELLLSVATCSDNQLEAQVRETVLPFFGYATLSHRWGEGEPLLREIQGRVVYEMGGTGGLEKLQEFCRIAHKHGFLWAWSDTCCIDKDSSAELQEAIGSMFSWYRRSSLTIVYLPDVSDTGSLGDSVWFKRGWTLQELLASPAVLFFTRNWSLYGNRSSSNHKKDGAILAEIQQATRITARDLTDFYPGMDNARSRLQWASMRSTTRPEDIAYSLFGIFKIYLPVLYGESVENALGRLLAEIISQSGDISVLQWVGEASSFHSCFPASITPYREAPYPMLAPGDAVIHSNSPPEGARKLYSALTNLPLPRFLTRRLLLPCIVHRVTGIKLMRTEPGLSCFVYEIHSKGLKQLELALSVKLKEASDGSVPYTLIRPWDPKSLDILEDDDIRATWAMLDQLEKPFNALLLMRLRQNEYKRIASDCTITVCVDNVVNIGDSELQTLEIV